jgi:hypothetical protein
MSDRYDELRAAAEAATPGPWQNGSDDLDGIVSFRTRDDGNVVCMPPSEIMEASREIWPKNATFIALANPETIKALLAERDSLLAALKPFADVSAKAKGADDACWCGQNGAVIRYSDLRRAAALTTKEG